ncbi:MAG TPA: hypothetical protein VJB98_02920 [Candidatus Paceibacterota bacterium]
MPPISDPILKYKLLGFTLLIALLVLIVPAQDKRSYNVERQDLGTFTKFTFTPDIGEQVLVSGEEIKFGKNKFILGGAANLPMQGIINEEGAIVLSKPGVVYVSQSESPIGVSFRENKCTGLLNDFQTFEPPLITSCADCRGESEYPEYNLCVEEHKTDPDFLLDTWRIYLGN